MVTLAFEVYSHDPYMGSQYYSGGTTIPMYKDPFLQKAAYPPPPKRKYDVISFVDNREAIKYMLVTCRKPVQEPNKIDVKNSHFNFSRWDFDSFTVNDGLLSLMKDTSSPGDF